VTDDVDVEQAKNPAQGPQFLQIVANLGSRALRGKRAASGRPAAKKPEPKLTRVALKVSRPVEFCSLHDPAQAAR
jgi:hypothetical protein